MGDKKNIWSFPFLYEFFTCILGTVQIVLLSLYLTGTGEIGDWPLVYVLMPLIIEGGIIALAFFCAGIAFALAKPTATTAEYQT